MTAELLVISDGQKVYMGRPAQPLDPQVVARMKNALFATGIVQEAHLPHVYMPGVTPQPGPVLILRTAAQLDVVSKAVDVVVSSVPEIRLLVLPLAEGHPLWVMVREQKLQLM